MTKEMIIELIKAEIARDEHILDLLYNDPDCSIDKINYITGGLMAFKYLLYSIE